MRLAMRIVLVVSLLVLLCTAALAQQEVTGSIAGTVKDPSGAVVPNATVTITNTDRNTVVKTLTTDASGNYVATLLPVGHYDVTIEAAGFEKQIAKGIELHVNDKYTLSPSLKIGQSGQAVEVAADAIQVQQQTAQAQGLITGTEVRELSLNNRVFEQLVTLSPGVSSGAGDQLYIGTTNPYGYVNRADFAINGARTTMNNWTIDGADNVDRGANLTLLNYPSVDAIAEFKVLRSQYDPEFGRAGGGQVNVVTRSGGHDFHGSAYEFWRNDILNANRAFDKAAQIKAGTPNKPSKLRYNNWGFTAGGPVYIPHIYEQRDKTFFFVSEEWRRVLTYVSNTAFLPTTQELQGIMQYPVCVGTTGNALYNGVTTANSCTGTIVPAGTPITNFVPISAPAAAYIKDIYSKMPQPQDTVLHSYALPTNRNVFNNWQNLVRIDHTFGPRLSIFGRYLHDTIPTTEPFSLFSSGVPAPGVSTTSTKSPGTTWAFRATSAITPTVLLEGGYSYSYGAIVSRIIGLVNPDLSPDIRPTITLPYKPTLARVPSLSITGYTGATAFGPYDDFNRNHSVFGTISKVWGSHTIKGGVTYHHYQKNENNGGNNPSSFSFGTAGALNLYPIGASTATKNLYNAAQAWTNFLIGRVATFSYADQDLTPDMRAHQIESFIQDEFRIRPTFTVTYGVRWSIFRQPVDANGQLSTFDPSAYDPAKAVTINPATGNIILNAAGTAPLVGDPLNGIIIGGKNSPYGDKVNRENMTDFAPRLGFAWDPWKDGRTSVRGGFGISHDFIAFGNYESNIFQNPPYVNSITVNPSQATVNPATFTNPAGGVVSAAQPRVLRAVDPKFTTPYVEFWSFDIQREVMPNFLVDIGYYGSAGHHLFGNYDINQPKPGAYLTFPGFAGMSFLTTGITTQTTQLNAIRPYLGYNAISYYTTIYNSNYHALQAAVQKRFSDGSLIKFNYTWSHNLANNDYTTPSGGGSTVGNGITAPQSIYCIKCEYGESSLDRRHMATVDWVYHLPFMRNAQGIVGHTLGGWELSGIATFQGGTALTPRNNGTSNIDVAGIGCLGSSPCILRPNQVGDPNANAPHSIAQWFNTSAFVADTTLGVPGNTRKGTIKGPGYWRIDVSLFKNFKLSDRFGLQFRGETFNILNHVNYNTVRTQLTSTDYGQVVSVRDPRIAQLGLKLTF